MTYHTFEIARMRLEAERALMAERYERQGRLLAAQRHATGQAATETERPARRGRLGRPAWQALMRALVHGTQLTGT